MEINIIIIDDDPAICTSLTLALEIKYNVIAVTNPIEGIDLIKEGDFSVCLLDLKIGKCDGIEILKKIKKVNKSIIVVMLTAYGSITSSVDAIKNGAYNYLTKPLNLEELYITIEKALEYKILNDKVEYLSCELENKFRYKDIIGNSMAMNKIYNLIDKLKEVDTNVVITGESGTGKELVARAIHFSGNRKTEKFIEINCAAIPEGLLEEELFGHKKGSFTGAIRDKQGKFGDADNGTIFLDEIGDMPFSLQSKLLRVLQQKEYSPIGSNDKRKINVRVIAATNKDLKTLVEQGNFREDLYFRLNVVELNLPPLRERMQDLPLLFNHFIIHYNEKLNKNINVISKNAERKLLNYDYPGNVRELSNILEYSMLLSEGDMIDEDSLPKEVINYSIRSKEAKKNNYDVDTVIEKNLTGISLKEIEKSVIRANLIENDWHRNNTAKILGISERGLRNKIYEYKLL